MQSKERLRQSYFSPLRLPGQTFLAVTFSSFFDARNCTMRERENKSSIFQGMNIGSFCRLKLAHTILCLPACLLQPVKQATKLLLFFHLCPPIIDSLFFLSFSLSWHSLGEKERHASEKEKEEGRQISSYEKICDCAPKKEGDSCMQRKRGLYERTWVGSKPFPSAGGMK